MAELNQTLEEQYTAIDEHIDEILLELKHAGRVFSDNAGDGDYIDIDVDEFVSVLEAFALNVLAL